MFSGSPWKKQSSFACALGGSESPIFSSSPDDPIERPYSPLEDPTCFLGLDTLEPQATPSPPERPKVTSSVIRSIWTPTPLDEQHLHSLAQRRSVQSVRRDLNKSSTFADSGRGFSKAPGTPARSPPKEASDHFPIGIWNPVPSILQRPTSASAQYATVTRNSSGRQHATSTQYPTSAQYSTGTQLSTSPQYSSGTQLSTSPQYSTGTQLSTKLQHPTSAPYPAESRQPAGAQRPMALQAATAAQRRSYPQPPRGAATQCNYCKKNGETAAVYLSHRLHDYENGRRIVVCPILSRLVCEVCHATGPDAHSRSYCPQQPSAGKPLVLKLLADRTASNSRKPVYVDNDWLSQPAAQPSQTSQRSQLESLASRLANLASRPN